MTYKSLGVKDSIKEYLIFIIQSLSDFFASKPKTIDKENKWLLFVKLDLLGDYVLFRNFIEIVAEQEKYKDHKIAFCCNAGVEEVSKFLDKDIIDKWIPLKLKPFVKSFTYRREVIAQLNETSYQVAFFPTQSRSFFHDDVIAKNINALQKVAPLGNGYNQTKWQNKLAKKYYTSLLDNSLSYAFEFELNKVFFSKALQLDLNISYPQIALEENVRNTIIISPGASAEFRRWSTQNFIELIRAILINEPKQEVIITGSPAEKPLGDAMKTTFSNIANVKNACGSMKLSQLCIELTKCTALFSNESGVVHLAKALRVPNIYCISNGNHYGRFNPYPSNDGDVEMQYIYPPAFENALKQDAEATLKKYYWGSRIKIDSISVNSVLSYYLK